MPKPSKSPRRPASGQRRARLDLQRKGVQVLREDNHVLVVSKPAGLASQGGLNIDVHLVSLIERYRQVSEGKPGAAFVGLVHRLDRNVSGVMVLGKTTKAAARLAASFRDRPPELKKIYLAWVDGCPKERGGTLVHKLARSHSITRESPDGRETSLAWRLVGASPRNARIEVSLHTGMSHQIRAQLSLYGYPIIGDTKYGGPRNRRTALHTFRLVIPHPVRDGVIDVAAPVPMDLKSIDRSLRIQPPA